MTRFGWPARGATGTFTYVTWMHERQSRDVDSRLAACERRWGLRCGTTLAGGFRSHVVACTMPNGDDAVLKLTVTPDEAGLEARALELWRDTGAVVHLLDADVDLGALLFK